MDEPRNVSSFVPRGSIPLACECWFPFCSLVIFLYIGYDSQVYLHHLNASTTFPRPVWYDWWLVKIWYRMLSV